jgi:hypothetical protein
MSDNTKLNAIAALTLCDLTDIQFDECLKQIHDYAAFYLKDSIIEIG